MNLDSMTKEDLINYINELNEDKNGKYGLVWDKEKELEQIVTECDKFIPVLHQVGIKDISNGGENNILIEGDNFHSLSVLNYTHKESVDVIYIDPPYNTGNKDFMYNDRFVDVEDGYRHSKWLNFMSKRLKLSRDLLKEDGVIMISIDDNEYAQLKIFCDKVFGEKNYLSTQHIQVRYDNKITHSSKDFSPLIEYVLIYCKNSDLFKPNLPMAEYDVNGKFIYEIKESDNGKKIKIGNDDVEVFLPEQWEIVKHEDGNVDLLKETWISGSIYTKMSYGQVFRKVVEPRINEDGYGCLYKVYGRGEDGLGFRYYTGPKKEGATKGKMYSGVPLTTKEELKSGNSIIYKPITNFYDYSADFGNIRQEGGVGFNSGKKPIKMLKELINYHNNKNAIVLDFFAGSGSTGHAVLDLNNEDGGNRKFILCTNNENNICEEITYPRLNNVINGYGTKEGLGGNLKYFKTDFVDYIGTKDQLYYDLTEKCIPMLCVKDDTFINEISTNEYCIYTDNNKEKYTCVYFDIFGSKYEDFIKKIENIKEEKQLYIFTLGDYVDESVLSNVVNYTIEAIPYKIVELYKKIVKMSKED